MSISSTRYVILFIIINILTLIFLGFLFLKTSFLFIQNTNISNIDAILNSTSIICGIGYLTFSFLQLSSFGKLFIMLFVSLGSIGLMTIIIFISSFFKKRGIEWYTLASGIFDLYGASSIYKFIKIIFFSSIIFEILGTITYKSIAFYNNFFISWIDALYISVNMFCNSGFNTSKEIYILFSATPSYYLLSSLLMLIGGIGFLVIFEIYLYITAKHSSLYLFSLTTKIIFLVYFFTTLISWILYFYFYENSFSAISLSRSLFTSLSMHAYGFMPYENATGITFLCSSLYGIIGTAPLGTGGGIRTSLFAILVYTPISIYNKYENVMIMKKSISWKKVILGHIYFLYILLISIFQSLILCLYIKGIDYIFLFSDILSCVTGLGLLSSLNCYSNVSVKIILILSIIIGKILSIIMGLNSSVLINTKSIQYPEGKLIII